MAGTAKDPGSQSRIVTELRSVSMMASKFLLATKSLVTDPNAPNVKNLLAQAARLLIEKHVYYFCLVLTLNYFLDVIRPEIIKTICIS